MRPHSFGSCKSSEPHELRPLSTSLKNSTHLRILMEQKKLKLFAAGDFHNDSSLAKKLAELAVKENVDLIILNGDIVEEDTPHGIVGHFTATNKKVVLVPGNHDMIATEFLSQLYKAPNLHGKYMIHYDVGIVGCGGANVGLHAVTEEEIYTMLKQGFEKIKHLPKKVMVTHVHPAGTKMEQFSHFIKGSIGVRKAIEAFQPDIVICGHVHEAEGIEEKIGRTTVINVGKKGKIIEV